MLFVFLPSETSVLPATGIILPVNGIVSQTAPKTYTKDTTFLDVSQIKTVLLDV